MSAKSPQQPPAATPLLEQMDAWPESWAGGPEDEPLGEALVDELRPFVMHLQQVGLTPKTVRGHLNCLWVIGGEIIRRLDDGSRPCKVTARKLLLDAIDLGEAPLANGASEAEQNALDATARRLLRYMTAHGLG